MDSKTNDTPDYSEMDLHEALKHLDLLYNKLSVRTRERDKYIHKLDREIEHRAHTEIQKESAESFVRKLNKDLKEKEERSRKAASQTAHDLRGPLSSIREITSRYKKEISDKDFSDISCAINRGIEICEEILSDAGFEISDKRVRTTIEKAELSSSIASVIDEIKNREKGAKHDIRFVKSDAPIIGNIKGSEIKSIISNLIDNGLDAIEEKNGDGYVEVTLNTKNDMAIVTISDNGKGMSPERLKVIGEYGKSFKKDGNGFGVWGAKRVLFTRGGKIKIDSTEGIGTTVYIEIPIALSLKDALILEKDSDLIIVDDERIIFGMIQFFTNSLQGYSGQVRYFEDVRSFEKYLKGQSREQIEKNRYLIDAYIVPNVPVGIELIKRNQLQDISVLFTSDHDLLSLNTSYDGIKVRSKDESPSDFISVVS